MTANRPKNLQSWFTGKPFEGQLLFAEPLARHTYYRIGGPADLVAAPKSLADLSLLAQAARELSLPVFILGLGSNVLVADAGFRGIVVKVTRTDLGIAPVLASPAAAMESRSSELTIRTGGSVAISTLLRRAATEGWGGLEFLTGIPGSVGGAVRMNAGTHLGETESRLSRIETFIGFAANSSAEKNNSATAGSNAPETRAYDRAEMKFEYRKNLFLPEHVIVLAAEWRITKEEPAVVKARIDDVLARRKATQPVDLPSCGSVFKNPRESGLSAWAVLDKLGLRGHRIGGAQVSEKHSNFIVNLGGATAADVRGLIDLAKQRAKDELSVSLHEEVIYLG